jgi:two-component system, NtrC family, sensor kinase
LEQLQTRKRDLVEAQEQQTATSEIWQVISSSPTGVEPVFEAIARSAATLCEADLSGVFTFDGELIHLVVQHGRTLEAIEAVRRAFPQAPGRRSVTARAILAAAAVQVPDHTEDPEVADTLRIYRTVLAVPMSRDDRPIGAISVARRVVRPFTEKQIALLVTFADQAVIAIENVRLFNETKEALEQQTATSEILRVISSSQTDVQPVFDAIAVKALDLCRVTTGWVYTFDGELIHVAAAHGLSPEGIEARRQSYPMPPSRGGAPRAQF